jgi:Flp pilus assembly pilin Flp
MTVLQRIRRSNAALKRRLLKGVTRVQDESGQTNTEYLMIVGLMAAVIVVVFVVAYWDNVKQAAGQWVGDVKATVKGDQVKPGDVPVASSSPHSTK